MVKDILKLASFVLIIIFIVSCDSEKSTSPNGPMFNIPADPGGEAPAAVVNNIIPPTPYVKRNASASDVIEMTVSGMVNPNSDNYIGLVANETFFLTEDSVLKGLQILKVSEGNAIGTDIIFCVDNSGSMGQEADSIAAKIINFVDYLSANGLNVKVGCVGYNGYVTGALNLTDGNTIKSYLNDRLWYGTYPVTGTDRTVGFFGNDSTYLNNLADSLNNESDLYGENGIAAITYADRYFNWTTGSARLYINFTDESIQPSGKEYWAVNGFMERWNSITQGVVHTIFSEDTTSTYLQGWTKDNLYNQKPWYLSWETGGETFITDNQASTVDLTTLPLTQNLANSVIVRFKTKNPEAGLKHNLKITVKTQDGFSDGEKLLEEVEY